jgi:predicted MFS family arabinose efflux permease
MESVNFAFHSSHNQQPPTPKLASWFSTVSRKMVWRPNEKIAVPLITACFCIIEFARGLDVGVLPSILPSIAREFHTSSVDAYWTSSIYILSATIAEPIFAGLSQAISRKFCLITSMCMFIVASVLCAMAQNITWLTGARLVRVSFPR